MLLEWYCGVQQGHSLRKEALSEPTGVGAEAPAQRLSDGRMVKSPW